MPASADAPSHAQLRYAMYEYLQAVIRSGKMTEEQIESLEVAAQCMSEAFGFSTEVPEGGQHELSLKPLTLPVIFNTGVQVPSATQELRKLLKDIEQQHGKLLKEIEQQHHQIPSLKNLFELIFFHSFS